jgi:hypothetical protein
MSPAIEQCQEETIKGHGKQDTEHEKNEPSHEKTITSTTIREVLILATNELAGELPRRPGRPAQS